MGEGIKYAIKADNLSLTAFQVGLNGWMAVMQLVLFLVERLHPDQAAYWFLMQLGMIPGFFTSYPANCAHQAGYQGSHVSTRRTPSFRKSTPRNIANGGKQIKGRKRYILVDTEGFLLKAKVHAASVFDRDGIELLLEDAKEQLPRLSQLWLDAGYDSKDKGKDWVEEALGLTSEIVKRPRHWMRVAIDQEPPPYPKGFIVLPRRWVVERSFS